MMGNKYEIKIYWSEADNCILAEVPELPGCMADGQTQELAVKNVKIVIEEWLEIARETDKDIPKPKGRLLYA